LGISIKSDLLRNEEVLQEKKKLQKWKEKIIVDFNAIMLENMKKRRGTSSITPNKVITKV
jgi:hypothetical protein